MTYESRTADNRYNDQPNYTIRAAARRTDRSVRTIERWVREGMRCRVVAGMIIIDHDELMTVWRERMVANPVPTRR